MPAFIKGLDLCEGFFHHHAKPILQRQFSGLRYTAGLIGYGSDVLGYDDAVSTDHMWGPRFYLFLDGKDIHRKNEILQAFAAGLPYTYKGYSVNFSAPDPNDGGVRHPEFIDAGRVSPLVWMHTPDEFLKEYLGREPKTNSEWLAVSEHRLLGFTEGKLFADGLQMQAMRDRVACYPKDVKLFLIASQWAVIAEEQAFVKRCGVRGDELGSRIVCARIAERLMRLCFLYRDRYAPYSKWFGTAFSALPVNPEIGEELRMALAAHDIQTRETHLVRAQVLLAELHNETGFTAPVSTVPGPYFDRDIQVLYTDRIAGSVQEQITDETLRSIPLFGSFSQVGNFVTLSDEPSCQNAILSLYDSLLENDPF